jgi:hypothetical protein
LSLRLSGYSDRPISLYFQPVLCYQCGPAKKQERMTHSKCILRITAFALLTIFLICILTVESHANERGSVTSRCPTCVDNNIHFAIDAKLGPALGGHRIVAYLHLPERAPGFSPSIVLPNNYRAPPA